MTNKLIIIINKMINHKVIKSNVKNLKQMFNEKLKLKLIINTKLIKWENWIAKCLSKAICF